MDEDAFNNILDALSELSEDSSVPRNVKTGIADAIALLKEKSEDRVRINRALNMLEELADDHNMQPYTRTQLFNVVSLLEMI